MATTRTMPTTESVSDVTEKIQESVVDFVNSVTSRFAEVVPAEVGQLMAKTSEVVDKAFEVTTSLIESQREFVQKLLKAATPSEN